jgi:hypothetical protein
MASQRVGMTIWLAIFSGRDSLRLCLITPKRSPSNLAAAHAMILIERAARPRA